MNENNPNIGDRWWHRKTSRLAKIKTYDFAIFSIKEGEIFVSADEQGIPIDAIAACDIPEESNVIIYQCCGKLWVRSVENFTGKTEDGQPRFEKEKK